MIQNDTLLFSDDASTQCVAVSVASVSPESCLTLTLAESTDVTGLTLSHSTATVCVVSVEGEFKALVT